MILIKPHTHHGTTARDSFYETITDKHTINQLLNALDDIKVRRRFSNKPDSGNVHKGIHVTIDYEEELNKTFSDIVITTSRLIQINSSGYSATSDDVDYSFFDNLYSESLEENSDNN